MKKTFLALAVGVALLLGIAAPLSAAHLTGLTLYGVTFDGEILSNELVVMDPATGESTRVGFLGESARAYGIAARTDLVGGGDKLYVFDQVDNTIRGVDKTTGKFNQTIDISVTELRGEGDLAFRKSDGVGFLASVFNGPGNDPKNDLFTFTITDDGTVAVPAAQLGSTGVVIDALAFDEQETLYGLGAGVLYTIDTTSGTATEVGPIGVPMDSPIAGIAFSPPSDSAPNGELYGSIDGKLYLIDASTGAATPVADPQPSAFTSISGITFAATPSETPSRRGGGR